MASLLSNGKQQFIDLLGRPLAGGKVYFYAPGTEVKKDTWQDEAMTIPNTNPVTLDMRGQAVIWGSGTYRQVLKDVLGNTVWDQMVKETELSLAGQIEDLTSDIRKDLDASTGANLVGFSHEASSAPGTIGARLKESISVKDAPFNAKGDGITDDTAALILAFAQGGDIYVPAGDYLIASKGPDAGGVEVTLTKSLSVRCHNNARFFTNGVDNDLFRFTVPSDGASLPARGISIEWFGGIVDQQGQKNSTVMPFTDLYPPLNQGASATCDGISIRGDYVSGGVVKSGIRRAVVSRTAFYAGEHWQTAGGDSAVFMGGCKKQRVENCGFQGARDVGFYASSDGTGVLKVKTECHNNVFDSCFHAVASKRSAGDYTVTGNLFNNCPRAVLWEQLIGPGSKGGAIAHNTFDQCGTMVRAFLVTGASIHDNHARNSGALLADGVTAESYAGCEGITLYGCTGMRVHDNTGIGVNAANTSASSYATTRRFLVLDSYDVGGVVTKTTKCDFSKNYCDGWRNLGTDTNGDGNYFDRNFATNTDTPTIVFAGATNYSEIRIDPSNVMVFNTPAQFSDGTAAAPGIARKNQASTGIFFSTNKIGLTVAGGERFAASNLGVAFNGAAPIAKQDVTGSRGGNAALSSLLTALSAYGLIANLSSP